MPDHGAVCEASVKCSACHFESPDGLKYCGQCGAALAARCPTCGATNPAGFRFCGHCGTALGAGPTPAPAPRAAPESYTPA
ncbi:MAG: DUF7577 domain-containing protein, partial [Candidatus Binatia bacterium]